MGLNLEQKQAVVAEVAKQVAGAQAIVMAENRGMAVADMTQLRAKARASGVYFRVVKNTLVRRAVAETPFASLADKMVGPLAYGIGPDPVAVAKVLNDFAKGNEKFVITGGAMPGQVMSAKEIAALAALPSRDELIAQADRHDAGAGRQARAHDERGAGASSSARSPPCATPSRRLRAFAANDYRNINPIRFRSKQCPQSKPKFSTRSRR